VDFIDGEYWYYTLMTYDEHEKQLQSATDKNYKFEALGVFHQKGNEIFRQGSNGGKTPSSALLNTTQTTKLRLQVNAQPKTS